MRILLVTPMPPRREAPGAIPLVLYAQLAGLRRSHEVTLVTGAGDEAGEFEACERLRAAGVDIHVVDRRQPAGLPRWQRRSRLASTWIRTRQPWRTVWLADPGVQRAIDDLTARRTFDVAAVEDSSMGLFRFPAGLPTVLTEHEVLQPRGVTWSMGPVRNWPGWAFAQLDRRRFPSFQRSVWQRFDRVQVFTDRDAESLTTLAPELEGRVHVNPFGIELPERTEPWA